MAFLRKGFGKSPFSQDKSFLKGDLIISIYLIYNPLAA